MQPLTCCVILTDRILKSWTLKDFISLNFSLYNTFGQYIYLEIQDKHSTYRFTGIASFTGTFPTFVSWLERVSSVFFTTILASFPGSPLVRLFLIGARERAWEWGYHPVKTTTHLLNIIIPFSVPINLLPFPVKQLYAYTSVLAWQFLWK